MSKGDQTHPEYGIKITIPTNDPFADLVGGDWEKTHWFSSAPERDRCLRDMQREHEYSRRGDKPSLNFAPVSRGINS